MTYQANPKSSGFRELRPHELDAVGGGIGTIVINLPRPSSGNIWSGSGDGAGGLGSGLSSFQVMDLSALAGLGAIDWEKFAKDLEEFGKGLLDHDGDGEIDEIVVTGDRSSGLNVLPISFDLASVGAVNNPGPVWHEPTNSCNFLRGMESFGSNALNVGAMLGALALAEPTPVGEAAAVSVVMVGGSANLTGQFFQWAIGCN